MSYVRRLVSVQGTARCLVVLAAVAMALSLSAAALQNSQPTSAGSNIPTPQSAPVTPREIAQRGFTADTSCARCHRDIAASYQTLGMARSFGKPEHVATVEDFEHSRFEHAGSGRTYEMTKRADDLVFRRWETADDGRPIHEIEQVVDWVLGSGSTSRTYLVQTASGRLFQLPIAWYSQESKWAMAPGFDSQPGEALHEGLLRPVRRECLFCHTAYPASQPAISVGESDPGGGDPSTPVTAGTLPGGNAGGSAGESDGVSANNRATKALDDRRFAEQVFPHELPEGIGCQRCHGPGAAHVAAAEAMLDTEPSPSASVDGQVGAETSSERRRRQRDAIRSTILQPAKLSPARRRDVCAQCHYQPAVAIFGQRQYDRRDLQFQAGETLADFIFELEVHEAVPATASRGPTESTPSEATDRPADPADRFEINHHAYRLEQSPCFLRSAPGQLECTSCHDPHRKLGPQEMETRVTSICLGCHLDEKSTKDSATERRSVSQAANSRREVAERGTAAASAEAAENDIEKQSAIENTKREDTPEPGAFRNHLRANHPQTACASCHMPRRRTRDVVHVVMTDHRIQRSPAPEAERLSPLAEHTPILLDLTPLDPPFAAHDDPAKSSPRPSPSPHDDPLMAQMVRATAVLRTGSLAPTATLDRLLGEAQERGWPDDLLLEPRVRLAQALLATGEIERSVTMLEELRGASELVDQPVQLLSVALARQGRAAEARALLLEVIARAKTAGESEPDTLLFNVALLDRALGEERDCSRLERTVELNDLLVQAWYHLGECYRRLDQSENAARAWERTLAIAPNYPDVPERLAELLSALGRGNEARRLLAHHQDR